MKPFLYDTHVHTKETSPCGKVEAATIARNYKQAGYDGIIITDHYYDGFFKHLKMQSWDEKVDAFLKGYKTALAEGGRIGIKVMLGMEIRFQEGIEEYLVYGVDEGFLKDNPELYCYTLEGFKQLVADKDILVFQAHPFRDQMRRAEPRLLDGIEVYNGHPRHNSKNHLAYSFAKEHGLMMIGGSDVHRLQDIGTVGIRLPVELTSIKELVLWYKSRKHVEIVCIQKYDWVEVFEVGGY